MRDVTPAGRRRPSCAACCGTGCFGAVVLLAAAFGWFMANTAQYRPFIPPPAPLPTPNGFDDYVAAGKMLKANGGTDAIDLYRTSVSASGLMGGAPQGRTPLIKPGPWKSLLEAQRAVVTNNGPALERMRAAFPKECRFPPLRSYMDLLPYLADIRGLARLLNAEADVCAAHGDYSGAFNDGLDAMEMANDVARGGVVIHGLVMVACTAIGQAPMVKYMDKLSSSACDRLADRMQNLLFTRISGFEILKEERDSTISAFTKIDDAILSGDPDALKQQVGAFGGDEGLGTPASMRSLPGRLWWRFYRDGAYREIDAALHAQMSNAKVPTIHRKAVTKLTNPIASIFSPIYSQALTKFDQNDARSRLILCALAIRSCLLKHGKLPGALNDLSLDRSLLIDPYSGKQFIYYPFGRDYLLYSVGPDLKDDGGIPLLKDDPQSGPGDIGIAMCKPLNTSPGKSGPVYRRVPHMKSPKLPPGTLSKQEWTRLKQNPELRPHNTRSTR